MNHRKILSRAWNIVWHYRALWVFGFLFALTGGGGLSTFNGGSSNGGGSSAAPGQPGTPGQFPNVPFTPPDFNTLVLIVVIAVAAALVVAAVALVVRYLAETALLAGVDEIEGTGAALTVRRGFRLGWSRQAWRLFLTDLLIYVPLTLGGLALVAAAALPLLIWLTKVPVLGILATVVSVGLELLIILGLIALAVALSVTMPYIRRQVVLEKQGVRAAIRQGIQLVRASLADTGLMWLLLAGLRIVWSLLMIPISILLVVLAALIGGIPAGIAYLLSQSWILAAVIGGPLFLLVIVPALALVIGLFETYNSASWTLTYREVATRQNAQPAGQAA